MELSEPRAFSSLVGRRVEDRSGRSLGRVFETRGHWERDGSVVLDELMVGRGAFWQRLRGPGAEAALRARRKARRRPSGARR